PPACGAPLQAAGPYRRGFDPRRLQLHRRLGRLRPVATGETSAMACAVRAAGPRAALVVALGGGPAVWLGAAARPHCRRFGAATLGGVAGGGGGGGGNPRGGRARACGGGGAWSRPGGGGAGFGGAPRPRRRGRPPHWGGAALATNRRHFPAGE